MIAEPAVAIFLALLIDFTFGDPKNKFHPTVWIGTLIAKLVPYLQSSSYKFERLAGMCVIIIPAFVVVFFLFLLGMVLDMITGFLYTILSISIVAILLKTTVAIRGMEKHAIDVVSSLEAGNLDAARERLSMIVKRDTKDLDEDHVYSAVVESISENIVDGVTGPLFYFGFFGLFGAFVYRTVNTADSMVGYKTSIFRSVGWFAATSDKILNYIPSRLTGLVMVFSSILLQNNWRESYRIMIRDCKKTESPNAGYPMAAAAGALDAKLEKLDHYSIGDGTAHFSKKHVASTITLMKVTSIVFAVIIVIPIISLMSYLGWWVHV